MTQYTGPFTIHYSSKSDTSAKNIQCQEGDASLKSGSGVKSAGHPLPSEKAFASVNKKTDQKE
eukprot:740151-Pelagomonas_calceolata.AAC.7